MAMCRIANLHAGARSRERRALTIAEAARTVRDTLRSIRA
jgi:hypothetical protein